MRSAPVSIGFNVECAGRNTQRANPKGSADTAASIEHRMSADKVLRIFWPITLQLYSIIVKSFDTKQLGVRSEHTVTGWLW